jgi:hypothetical protein
MSPKKAINVSTKLLNQIKNAHPSYSSEQILKDIKLITKDHPSYNSEQIKKECFNRYNHISKKTEVKVTEEIDIK